MENCEKVERRWDEEEMENLRIINERIREELGKQEENDDTDLDGPEDELMQIVNEMHEREELNKEVESRVEEEEYIKNRDIEMLSEYDDNVFLYDYIENIEENIYTVDVPGTSAQTSTGNANPSPAKRRRKRGVTHYTQKKRRTVAPLLCHPRVGWYFSDKYGIVEHHFPSPFFQTIFCTN